MFIFLWTKNVLNSDPNKVQTPEKTNLGRGICTRALSAEGWTVEFELGLTSVSKNLLCSLDSEGGVKCGGRILHHRGCDTQPNNVKKKKAGYFYWIWDMPAPP